MSNCGGFHEAETQDFQNRILNYRQHRTRAFFGQGMHAVLAFRSLCANIEGFHTQTGRVLIIPVLKFSCSQLSSFLASIDSSYVKTLPSASFYLLTARETSKHEPSSIVGALFYQRTTSQLRFRNFAFGIGCELSAILGYWKQPQRNWQRAATRPLAICILCLRSHACSPWSSIEFAARRRATNAV